MADEGNGNGMIEAGGKYATFAGGGFGTIQVDRAIGGDPAPESVSARRYMRDGLPGIYSDGDFGMRFVGALEEVLDPLVAAVDNMADHFDPTYAPRDVLDMFIAWLGLEHDEARSGEERRRIVQMAPELMRRRGTKAGLELALDLAFPGVPFRVEDAGKITWATELGNPLKIEAPTFVVYCDMPLPDGRQAAVARLIEKAKPAHVGYRLRVKRPKASS